MGKIKELLNLFTAFFRIGILTFGGGYAMLPMLEKEVVEKHKWATMEELMDYFAISQCTPGVIAVNTATFVGTRVAGFAGALVATVGCIFPSLIIVSLLAFIYYRFKNLSVLQSVLSSLRPAVVALIAGAGLSILGMVVFGGEEIALANIDWIGFVLFALAFFVLRKFKCSPIPVMLACGVIGLAAELIVKGL